jgi:heme exporter protein D
VSWNSPGEFFAMGGYAFYVWGSFGVAALCIAAELWWLVRRARTLTDRPSLKDH